MCRKNILIMFLGLLALSGVSRSSPVIKLVPGLNELSIKVFNNCNVDIETLSLTLKNNNLPEGITVSIYKTSIDAPAKKKSERSLMINIEVSDKVKDGAYLIPILLKDNANHSWDFELNAELMQNLPEAYALNQNYPNPFNPETHIVYALAADQDQLTRLVIYNTLGEQIRSLVNEKQAAGNYRVVWDGKDDAGKNVASGVYFYRINSGTFQQIKKMTVIR